MHTKNTAKPILPSTANDLQANVMAEGCDQGDILEIDSNQPNYPIPLPQVMARQEPTRSA